MKLMLLLVGVASLLIASVGSTTAQRSDLSPEAQEVYAYVAGLAGEGMIIGQFGSFGDQTNFETAQTQLERVHARSGRYPAMTGFDMYRPHRTPEQSAAEAVVYSLAKWQEGYLISLSWHSPNPCIPIDGNTYGLQWPEPVLDVTRALPGGDCHEAWMEQLDLVGGALEELRDAGVPVFWRPLHEMNGGWFWWHRQPSPEPFVQLWRHMHDTFTERGLNNLIWVYSPNAERGDSVGPVEYYYPGDEYVDFVGMDLYMRVDDEILEINQPFDNPAFLPPRDTGGYDRLLELNKPIGLFEFGPIPASGRGWDTRDYCWTDMVRDVQELYPQIVVVQAWEYVWQIGRDPYRCQDEMMNHPYVISLDELPWYPGAATEAEAESTPEVEPEPAATEEVSDQG